MSWDLLIVYRDWWCVVLTCNFFVKTRCLVSFNWFSILPLYAQNGDIEKARDEEAYGVYCRMSKRNASTWAVGIACLAQVDELDEAKRLLLVMKCLSIA